MDAIKIICNERQTIQDTDDEQQTKGSLITPILVNLGYNLFSPYEVEMEHPVCVQPNSEDAEYVDYAILLDNAYVMYIEAKALNVNLDGEPVEHLRTLIRHGEDSLKKAILTNGYEWRVYTVAYHNSDELFRTTIDKLSNDIELLQMFIHTIGKSHLNEDTSNLVKAKREQDNIYEFLTRLLTPNDDNYEEVIDDTFLKYVIEKSGNSFVIFSQAMRKQYKPIVYKAIKDVIHKLTNNEAYSESPITTDNSCLDEAQIADIIVEPQAPQNLVINMPQFEDIIEEFKGKTLKYSIIEQEIAYLILEILKNSGLSNDTLYLCRDNNLAKHCNAPWGKFISYVVSPIEQKDILYGTQIKTWAIRYGNSSVGLQNSNYAEVDPNNGAIAFNIGSDADFDLIKALLPDCGNRLSKEVNQDCGQNNYTEHRCWISLKDVPASHGEVEIQNGKEHLYKIYTLKEAIIYCFKKQINAGLLG